MSRPRTSPPWRDSSRDHGLPAAVSPCSAGGESRIARLGRFIRRVISRSRQGLSAALVDRRHGIETSRPVDLTNLGLDHEDRIEYVPSGWRDLDRALRHLEVGPNDVFLDLGSGKGRMVLQAADHPFKRVIGVEISAQLNAVAAANLEARRPRLLCKHVELIESDILDYRVPDDVTVAYAYNPFRGVAFEAAMRALIASFDRRPRTMYLIYRNPREHARLIGSGRFRLLATASVWRPTAAWTRSAAIHIYDIGPGAPSRVEEQQPA